MTNGAGASLIGRIGSRKRSSPRIFREARFVTQRPGFGLPHDDFLALVAARPPATSEEVSWSNGAVRFGVAGHLTPVDEVPDELVTSARCIVRVRDRVLVCTNADGVSHVLPGGRRNPAESAIDAAVREVHEETGWYLDRSTLRQVGWLHFTYRTPVAPAFEQYPHPDFVHAVFTAQASGRDEAQGAGWIDTEGYVIGSEPRLADDALDVVADLVLDRVLLEEALGRRR